MRLSEVEFRYRYWLHVSIYALGFWAPWERWLSDAGGGSTWLWLAAWCARSGWSSFSAATVGLLVLGIVCAVGGAGLRTWGSAYLGAEVVQDGAMHGESIVADGPYRRMRNPLYVGTWLHTLALALLMPPSGAAFVVVAITLLQLRLMSAEEAFLAPRLGEAYAAYCAAVPRILPALRPRVVASGRQPRWGTAALGEVYMIGVAIAFAAAGWRYNAHLLLKCVIVSLGVSLVARAFITRSPPADVIRS